jgi:TPR repeat protein
VTPKVTPERIAPAGKIAAKREPRVNSVPAPKPPAPEADDSGSADFHKAEAYLYGRGAAENCDEAVKYLKSASAKSNAKARSAFGTMYATGHCVPRDLPTSYLWFALALRVDPNNQILEKDLNAVWNQMTPPERQMATRMKQ